MLELDGVGWDGLEEEEKKEQRVWNEMQVEAGPSGLRLGDYLRLVSASIALAISIQGAHQQP